MIVELGTSAQEEVEKYVNATLKVSQSEGL